MVYQRGHRKRSDYFTCKTRTNICKNALPSVHLSDQWEEMLTDWLKLRTEFIQGQNFNILLEDFMYFYLKLFSVLYLLHVFVLMKMRLCCHSTLALRHTENMGDCCHCYSHCLPIVPTVALLLQQASWQLPLGCILLFFHPFWRDVPLLLMSHWLYSLHLMMTVYYCFPECINYC